MGLLDGNSQNLVIIAVTVITLLIIETPYPKTGGLGIYDVTVDPKMQPGQAYFRIWEFVEV